jgi:molecular chaperone DnaK (HSP70)
MVEESVEFAFDDLKARQWIEAKLRATETVKATQKALQDCSSEIEPGYKSQIEGALAIVESLLEHGDAGEQAGDTNRLKAALAALDEITKPLAETLMDRAMEAVLRKRGLIS